MQNVYTVGQINSYIRRMFAEDFLLQELNIMGEVSNCKYHSSGHIYFTLKDMKGTISCVMFAGNRSGLSFRMTEGMQVVVQGTVDVYERDGKYQVYAKRITLDGEGALFERFQRLKEELLDRGMFAPDYKKPIPKYIRTLGVVTASTGAAVRDIINITHRRNPYVQILLYPAIVQGEGAADSIVRGIHMLEQQKVDVMIVGRGGGSIEDLWAFNEEKVAQAVFDCEIPIISAVGHETDVTIADYVADLRAPTPSAAAELAVYDVRLVLEELYGYKDRLARCILAQVDAGREHLDFTEKRLRYLNPENQMVQKRQYLIDIEERLFRNMKNELQKKKQMMSLLAARLDAKSPLKRLAGGYAYVTDEAGRMVDSVKSLQVNDVLMMTFSDGVVKSEVQEVVEEEKA